MYSVVAIGKIRAELGGVVAHWAEVVINNIENDREVACVASVHKALKGFRAAVGFVNGKERGAVVPPAAVAGEVVDRHDLDVGDA